MSNLIVNGLPRYVRCYDNGGKSADRYTVVFTRLKAIGCYYITANNNPTHPQGICMHGWAPDIIDRPKYSHLGKKVKFTDLPEALQTAALKSYRSMWKIK